MKLGAPAAAGPRIARGGRIQAPFGAAGARSRRARNVHGRMPRPTVAGGGVRRGKFRALRRLGRPAELPGRGAAGSLRPWARSTPRCSPRCCPPGSRESSQRIAALEGSTAQRIAALEGSTAARIAELDGSTAARIAELDGRLSSRIAETKADLVKWMLAALTAQTALILGAFKLL